MSAAPPQDAESKVVQFGDPRAPSAQENRAVNWRVSATMILAGIPSGLAVLSVATVNCRFAASFGAVFVPVAIIGTGLLAALPLSVDLLRPHVPNAATWAKRLWVVCIGLSILAALVQLVQANVQPAAAPSGRIGREKANTRLDGQIAALQAQLSALPATRMSASAAMDDYNDLRLDNADIIAVTDDCRAVDYDFEARVCSDIHRAQIAYWASMDAAHIRRQLADLQAQIRPEDAPQAAMIEPESLAGRVADNVLAPAFFAALIIMAAAVGPWITASSIKYLLSGRTQFPVEPARAGDAVNLNDEEDTPFKYFRDWADLRLKFGRGEVKASDAYKSYAAFAAINGKGIVWSKQQFGDQMSALLDARGGGRRHSNGTIFTGLTLVDDLTFKPAVFTAAAE